MKINRRKNIVEAATKSFTLFGYKATSMEQIAKLAGVGKGTIYTFFNNKQELLHEIIQELISEMKDSVIDVLESDIPFLEKINHCLFEMMTLRKKQEFIAKMTDEARVLGTEEVKQEIVHFEQSILSFIEQYIQVAIQKKEIKPCNPKVTAFLFVKMYRSFTVDWEKENKPLTKDELLSYFQLYLIDGLKGGEGVSYSNEEK